MATVSRQNPATPPARAAARLLPGSAIIFLIYLAAFSLLDWMTSTFQIFPGVVAWYPPDGVSFAFLLALGARFIPAVAIASLISNFLIYQLDVSSIALIVWSILLSGSYGIAAGILRRIRMDVQLRSVRDVLALILSAAIVAAFLAIISVSVSVQLGAIPAADQAAATFQWWIGETIGILVVTPVLLIHVLPWLKRIVLDVQIPRIGPSIPRPNWKVIAQALSVLAALYLVFGVPALAQYHPLYLLAVPLIWLALDYGLAGISIGILAVNFGSTFLIWAMDIDKALLGELQLLMLVISAVGLLMGAVRTERMQARAAQEQSDVLSRVLFEFSPEAILLIDPHDPDVLWPIIDCNQMACEMNGYSREELIGQSIDLINETPGDRDARNASLKQLREEGIRNREALHRRKDGTVFPIEYSSRLITVGGRELVIGIDRDITDRQQAEITLRANEGRFRALIENSSDEIVVLDSELHPTYVSPSVLRASGSPIEEIESAPPFSSLADEDQAAAQKVYQELLQKPGQPVPYQLRLMRKDGSARWTEGIATNLLGDPHVRGIVLNYRDITKRKQAEQALRENETRYRSLFEDSPISLWEEDFSAVKKRLDGLRSEGVTDLQAYLSSRRELVSEFAALVRLLDVNKAALQLYRAESKEHLLGSLEEVVNQEMLDHFKEELVTIAEGRTYFTWEGPDRTLNGEPIHIRVSWSVVPGYEQDFSKVIVSVIDITDIKRAQDKISRQLDHLAALTEIDRAITSSVGLEISLGTVLSYVIAQLGVDAADVLLLDTSSLRLRFAAGRGFRTAAFTTSSGIRLGEGYAGQAALERRLIHIPNLALRTDNPRFQKALPAESFVSYHGVPLIAKGNVVGVLEVFHRSPLQPDREWLDFLNTLASQAAIAIDNANLFNNLQHSNLELTVAYDATIEGWSHALDLRDKEVEGHTQRVTDLTLRLAKMMGLPEDTLLHIRRGALLHDIGKMGIPDSILQKPGALTEAEWEIMRRHPQFAYDMLSSIPYLKPALDIPYCHHEKWDGTGYPRGLLGEQIPMAARIFAVVDVWDELTSDRPYRAAWTKEKALEYIREESGKHFDPRVVRTFLETRALTK